MILTKNARAVMQHILETPDNDFAGLVKASGLDPARDFRGADLRGIDFRGADLRGFDFSGADLRGAGLRGAMIEGATFTEANIDDANRADVAAGPKSTYGPFHRLKSATQSLQLARLQQKTERLIGRAGYGASLPSVKAYVGPLPPSAEGIEFTTDVEPKITTPFEARWSFGDLGVLELNDQNESQVFIPVNITKIVYSEAAEVFDSQFNWAGMDWLISFDSFHRRLVEFADNLCRSVGYGCVVNTNAPQTAHVSILAARELLAKEHVSEVQEPSHLKNLSMLLHQLASVEWISTLYEAAMPVEGVSEDVRGGIQEGRGTYIAFQFVFHIMNWIEAKRTDRTQRFQLRMTKDFEHDLLHYLRSQQQNEHSTYLIMKALYARS